MILERNGERATWRWETGCATTLAADELRELLDRAASIGEGMQAEGRPVVVGALCLVFTDPRGAFDNRDLIRELLASRSDGRVTVEIRSWAGERLVMRSLTDIPRYAGDLERALNRWLGYRPPSAMPGRDQ